MRYYKQRDDCRRNTIDGVMISCSTNKIETSEIKGDKNKPILILGIMVEKEDDEDDSEEVSTNVETIATSCVFGEFENVRRSDTRFTTVRESGGEEINIGDESSNDEEKEP